MQNVLEYKCPNCAGKILFDAATGSFKCESCDSVFSQAQLDAQFDAAHAEAMKKGESVVTEADPEYDWKTDNSGTMGEMNAYSCKSCGAQITTDPTTAASECPYCGSPIIMTGKVSGLNRPNCILPFKLDKNAAQEALKKFAAGKKLLPSNFLSANHLESIKGVYVPFWLFNSDVNAACEYRATKKRTWSDSNFRYTETTTYRCSRAGVMGFDNIPVDGSSTMPDDYMDGIEPFDYGALVDFNAAYLPGFLADKYDVDAVSSFPRAQTRITNSTAEAMRATVKGYDTVNTVNTNIIPENSSYRYAMLPVWLLNTEYAGKKYLFAVNGQTGKVSGTLPVDSGKATRMGLFTGLGVAAVLNLIYLLITFLG